MDGNKEFPLGDLSILCLLWLVPTSSTSLFPQNYFDVYLLKKHPDDYALATSTHFFFLPKNLYFRKLSILTLFIFI